MSSPQSAASVHLRKLLFAAIGVPVVAALYFLSESRSGDPLAEHPLAEPSPSQQPSPPPRERISINTDWRFFRYGPGEEADALVYDVRPEIIVGANDQRPADAEPTEPSAVEANQAVLKRWILPTGNRFVADPKKHHIRPQGNPGADFPFVQLSFDDSAWESVHLPHDWAIAGPFLAGPDAAVGGGMGRLPSPGVGWYRKTLNVPQEDSGKRLFLDVDGAMSYASVWLNGQLVGGWPFGYASWRVDLTPYVAFGAQNQLAIRLDNPPDSSRWYPGGGLYRNVWLTKTRAVHVAHWGTTVTTRGVSTAVARIDLDVAIDNDSDSDAQVEVSSVVYPLTDAGHRQPEPVARFEPAETSVPAGKSASIAATIQLSRPRLWGPPPKQRPNLYLAVTTLRHQGNLVDEYETRFGVREVRFDPNQGVLVNGEPVTLRGANQHHDLGALGAAFNTRAAERQLETLQEMGCNAVRMAHNPPAPELLELTDRMGFLVVDESFDVWARKKAPLDFHLIFQDWHEQDLRSMVRRDKNHPSVVLWSIGNEVGEQFTAEAGAAVAKQLHDIVQDEDPSRPTTTSMNFAKPDMPLPPVTDVISLNYQGEGIRDAPAYAHLKGIRTTPLYPGFHQAFPAKLVLSSENAAALSSRGEYLFPVTAGISAPVEDGQGGDPERRQVSAYELYTAPFGSSADKVFGSLERHPYVGGGFVWSGWDYLGEPTPYYEARSSYFGTIDLAGFKKDRFYLYQAHWRPELAMAHILPHWTWPERIGKLTPVHVFTSGDEAELFLNGKSLGRKKKGPYEYRLRWDQVRYAPGELKVVAYKDGKEWASEVVRTAGDPTQLAAFTDRESVRADGKDLAFVTVRVTDDAGLTVPRASNSIQFQLDGPAKIVATDNGDPTDLTPFPSSERAAFNGLCLVILRTIAGEPGRITLKIDSPGLQSSTVAIRSQGD